MSSRRRSRSVLFAVTFLSLLIAFPAASQTKPKKKTSARKAMALPPGAINLQDVIIPGCEGFPSQQELVEPSVIGADGTTHTLSTTLDVVWARGKKVPVYKNTGKCSVFTFDLRQYVDPTDGQAKLTGPTLKVARATSTTPGDRIKVMLQNHLGSTDERCVYYDKNNPMLGNCFPDAAGKSQCANPPTGVKAPQCCKLTTPPVGMDCFHGDSTTNLHFHGTHASPQEPQDWVLLQLQPFKTAGGTNPPAMGSHIVEGQFQYDIDPLPWNQAEGTHWYHPHKHGSTAEQVGNGMAGAVIVTGPFDAWLNDYYKKNNGIREHVMVVQQIHDLNFTSTNAAGGGSVMPLINGQLVPTVVMYRNEVQRWRLISATMEASAQIVIDFNGVRNTPVKAMQIAMDGVQFSPNNYYCQPLLDATPCDGNISDLQFRMSPGNRGDFLIKAPDQLGTFMVPYEVFGNIENQGEQPKAPAGRTRPAVEREKTRTALDAAAPSTTQPALLAIKVIECPTGQDCNMNFPDRTEWPPLPSFLKPIQTAGPGQDLQFQINPGSAGVPSPTGQFAIWVKGKNGGVPMQFDESCAVFTEPLDPNGGEEWRLSQNINNNPNKDGFVPPMHVFHIHTNPFQLVSTFVNNKKVNYDTCTAGATAPCVEPIWQDSVTLPDNNNPSDPNNPSGFATIRQRFEDYTGPYVIHCHFLGHEDRGMMLTVQTVCPTKVDGAWKYSVTSPTVPECTTSGYHDALPDCDDPAMVAARKAMMHSETQHQRMKKH